MMDTNPGFPPDLEWLFPEYDFAEMGLSNHQGVIIERVLEKGSWEQVRWLFTTYGEETVTEWVRKHGFRLLSKRSFALWKLALDVKEIEVPEWVIQAKVEDPW
jgi:hypothetical protein